MAQVRRSNTVICIYKSSKIVIYKSRKFVSNKSRKFVSNKPSKIEMYHSSNIVIYKSSKIVTYQPPVLHGTVLEICDCDAVVLGQGVADPEEVGVEGEGPPARVHRESALKFREDLRKIYYI